MVKTRGRCRTDFPRICIQCSTVIYDKNKWSSHTKQCQVNAEPAVFPVFAEPQQTQQIELPDNGLPKFDTSKTPKSPEEFNDDIANYVFHLKRRFDMEETKIEYILDFTSSLMKNLLAVPSDKVDIDNFVDRSFARLETKFLREKTFSKSTNCSPIQLENSAFTYLPVRQQVSQMLEPKNSLREHFSKAAVVGTPLHVNGEDELIRSTLDGKLAKSVLQSVQSDYVVPIVLFFDEFCEVCPIGPFVENNKMAVFQWKAISRHIDTEPFILAVAKSSELKLAENSRKVEMLNSVIMQLLEDIGKQFTLEDGSTCEIVVVAFCADNLAQHQVGAFYESFSAIFPCLRCLLPKTLFHTTFNDQSMGVRLRTFISTRKQIAAIQNARGAEKAKLCKKTGLVGTYPAVMNLPHIGHHFPDFFPTEIMHDILQDKSHLTLYYLLLLFVFYELPHIAFNKHYSPFGNSGQLSIITCSTMV